MPDIQQEKVALAMADQHISAGERRINNLIEQIREGESAGRDTAATKRLLMLIHETLDQWHVHRPLILDAIAQCDR